MKLYTILLLSLFVHINLTAVECFLGDLKFYIIVPSYNNQDWVQKNLDSIFNQEYQNFKVIYINDASTDNTEEEVYKYCTAHDKLNQLIYVKNEKNSKTAHNIYNAVHCYCEDYSVVVILDGDDWFYDTKALTKLYEAYQDPHIWLTYGNIILESEKNGEIYPRYALDQTIIENHVFRHSPFGFHPLRTCYAKLFKKIKISDLMYCNRIFTTAGDMAFGLALMELAGSHMHFISDFLYVYNNILPTNEFRMIPKKQVFLDHIIRNRDEYETVSDLFAPTPDPICTLILLNTHELSETKRIYFKLKKFFPFSKTLAYLSGKLLPGEEKVLSQTRIITEQISHTALAKTEMLKIKGNILSTIEQTNSDYFIISPNQINTDILSRFSPDLLVLSDIIVLADTLTPLPTQGLAKKHPHVKFLSLDQLGETLDLTKPFYVIITKKKLVESIKNTPYLNNHYMAFLTAIAHTFGDYHAAII